MSQTTQLYSNAKAVPRVPAQVVALDPRRNEPAPGNNKYVRVLQLSDLLSRHLEVAPPRQQLARIALDPLRLRLGAVDVAGAERRARLEVTRLDLDPRVGVLAPIELVATYRA